MKKAPFIVIDGGDGSGKSTQLKLLQQHYQNAIFTREPGGSPYAEDIRNVLLNSAYAEGAPVLTKLLGFFAARADHIDRLINPSFEEGKLVISDRFDSSTFAYQIWGLGRQDLIPDFDWLRQRVVSNCLPDAYIYLDVIPEVGMKRKKKQEDEKLNYFDHSSLAEVSLRREGFLEFFKRVKEPHYIVDANQPIQSVFDELVATIDALIRKG